jgi:hypothetical protein
VDKATQPVVKEKESIGGIEGFPVYLGDIFYHMDAGKVMFTEIQGEVELVYVDTKLSLPYTDIEDVLKHSSWSERDITEVNVNKWVNNLTSAMIICNTANSTEIGEVIKELISEVPRLVKSSISWRSECLNGLNYATAIEEFISKSFKDIIYFKSDQERLADVLVNIKRSAMLLADKHNKLVKEHTNLIITNTNSVTDLNEKLTIANKLLEEVKSDKLSQQLVFNAVLEPRSLSLESAARLIKERMLNIEELVDSTNLELNTYYRLVSDISIIAYYYTNSANVTGFGLNQADGGFFIPEKDLVDTKIFKVVMSQQS